MAKESTNTEILRAKWHDYHAPGCYLITMVTEGRERHLGTLEGDSEESAAIRLSETGKVLEDAILHDIEHQFPEVEVIKHIVMEDQCHIALRVKRQMGQVAKQKVYIDRNPARLWLKRHSDSAFTKVCNLCYDLPFSLAQQLKDTALYWDQRRNVYHSPFSHRHDNSHYAETYKELVQRFLRRRVINSAADTTASWQPYVKLRSCGNVSLLQSPRPLPPHAHHVTCQWRHGRGICRSLPFPRPMV